MHWFSEHAPNSSLRAILLSLLMVMCAVSSVAAQPSGCHIGAYIEQDPIVAGDIELFERLVGRKHASYMCYLGYGQPFPTEWVKQVHERGALPHIAWEPNDGLGEVRDDAYLRGWAQAAAQADAPILLRFASEMNGTWMAYSGNPNEYVRKWRLVYSVIKQAAANVIMVWCPFATPRRTIPLYYPGDEYVDWVGVNIYAVLYNDGNITQPAPDDQLDNLRYISNLYGARKPIAICEYAATHYCTASRQHASGFAARKMQQMYQAVAEQAPNVVLLNWFSVDAAADGLAHNDYAVTTNGLVLETYRELISGAHFLAQLLPSALVIAATQPPGQATPETPVPLALTGHPVVSASQVAITVKGRRPAAVSGRITLDVLVGSGVDAYLVEVYVDGRFHAMSNVAPYRSTWNADRAVPGVHVIRVVVRNRADQEIAHHEAAMIVPEAE